MRFIRISITVIILGMPVFSGCLREKSDRETEKVTRVQLSEWKGIFRLYYAAHTEPAESLSSVLADVQSAVRSIVPNWNVSKERSTAFLNDGWGIPLQCETTKLPDRRIRVQIVSAGRDHVFGTEDDLREVIVIEHPGKGTDP